jgi:hypothetical protein
MNTAPANQSRIAAFFIIIPATVLTGALGSSLGGLVAATIGGAV